MSTIRVKYQFNARTIEPLNGLWLLRGLDSELIEEAFRRAPSTGPHVVDLDERRIGVLAFRSSNCSTN